LACGGRISFLWFEWIQHQIICVFIEVIVPTENPFGRLRWLHFLPMPSSSEGLPGWSF
jgi:hypothetical protein